MARKKKDLLHLPKMESMSFYRHTDYDPKRHRQVDKNHGRKHVKAYNKSRH